jgi:hypothetical protein
MLPLTQVPAHTHVIYKQTLDTCVFNHLGVNPPPLDTHLTDDMEVMAFFRPRVCVRTPLRGGQAGNKGKDAPVFGF